MFQQVLKQAILEAHPVGSIYESTDSTSPEVLFGGTWETMEAGRVLVSSGTASTGTVYTVGAKGGEEKHQISVDELPKVKPTVTIYDPNATQSTARSGFEWKYDTHCRKYTMGNNDDLISLIGGNSSHNNMQPYEVVYRWKRIA